ncbi:hypothetical protein [Moraxella marmotae]|uniref:hypothetical protein n=1 Tax=Moraxella marmotae TaxID=3344520 RepID=UPI0035F28604
MYVAANFVSESDFSASNTLYLPAVFGDASNVGNTSDGSTDGSPRHRYTADSRPVRCRECHAIIINPRAD